MPVRAGARVHRQIVLNESVMLVGQAQPRYGTRVAVSPADEHEEDPMAESYIELTGEGRAPIKAWVRGVALDEGAQRQLENTARLPFVFKWIAAMPDVHWGLGATVGSVVATKGAIVPAAVGVDIGCGMAAVRTTLTASDLPDDLRGMRAAIERAVPVGFTAGRGKRDTGSWHDLPERIGRAWEPLAEGYRRIVDRHPKLSRSQSPAAQLGTLGSGNHFIEVCLDEEDRVWFMLHSGSRGVGNRIGSYFIERAREEMRRLVLNLPDRDLAYLREGTEGFDEYVEALHWAQGYAAANRRAMMASVVAAVGKTAGVPPFETTAEVVDCHHNYVAREIHFGEDVLVTRKGAVRAAEGDLGIIPGSMGARSYIVRGKGNPESFASCSHGAGRVMSRNEAKRRFTVADHEKATAGVECRKDAGVIDETPAAYKPIDAVMEAQKDLVDVVHRLRQVVCVKG
jgi:tRNA-splicing ligase RtcB (3'-phosphate/5'-hydroxy nucleic acid ligase)